MKQSELFQRIKEEEGKIKNFSRHWIVSTCKSVFVRLARKLLVKLSR